MQKPLEIDIIKSYINVWKIINLRGRVKFPTGGIVRDPHLCG